MEKHKFNTIMNVGNPCSHEIGCDDAVKRATLMDYKKWLDEVVAVYKRLVELDEQGGEDVGLCVANIKSSIDEYINIHVFEGLQALADAVGAVIIRDETEPGNHEYYFIYDGCKVFSLEVR